MKSRYLIYFLLLLPLFIFRDYTPANELRYVSIVEEALENGTFFTFYNHGSPYADKPPLYFWWMMLTRVVTGGYHLWLMGLMSILPAIGIMAIMEKWLKIEKIGFHPLAASLMLGTTVMFLGGAVVLRMDMMMVFFITLSLFTFFRMYKRVDRPSEKYLLPVYVFLAIFSKGAVGLLLPLVCMAAFLLAKKEIRHFGKFFGWTQWGILLGLCILWFSAIYIEGGNEYLNNLLFKQTVGRGINSFHHKEPFYFYFTRFLFTFAPWSLLYLFAMVKGGIRRAFTSDTEKFFVTAILTMFLIMSLVSSKIDIYLLPVYPFIAYLTAAAIGKNSGDTLARWCVCIPAGAVALIFPALLLFSGNLPLPVQHPMIAFPAVFFLSAGGIASIVYCVRKNLNGAIASLALGILVTVFIASFDIKSYNRYIGLGEIARAGQSVAKEKGVDEYYFFDFGRAENMDAYLGKELVKVSDVGQLDSADRTSPEKILFVRTKEFRWHPELEAWLGNREIEAEVDRYRLYLIGRKP